MGISHNRGICAVLSDEYPGYGRFFVVSKLGIIHVEEFNIKQDATFEYDNQHFTYLEELVKHLQNKKLLNGVVSVLSKS